MKITQCGLAFFQTSAGSALASTTPVSAAPINASSDEPMDNRKAHPQIRVAVSPKGDNVDSSDDDEDYYSVVDVEDSDDEDIGEGTDEDWAAREKERQRVLEAAGLIVNQDVKPPPRLQRVKSARQRRPPPAAPQRSSIVSNASVKDLPPVPEPENSPVDPTSRLDDAFDRYETFKQTQGNPNHRLSVASSFETAFSTPAESPTVSATPSTSNGDTRTYSHLFHFLGRKTPGNDNQEKRTLTISGPIMNRTDSPSRENSPAFGTVRSTGVIITSETDKAIYHSLGRA